MKQYLLSHLLSRGRIASPLDRLQTISIGSPLNLVLEVVALYTDYINFFNYVIKYMVRKELTPK